MLDHAVSVVHSIRFLPTAPSTFTSHSSLVAQRGFPFRHRLQLETKPNDAIKSFLRHDHTHRWGRRNELTPIAPLNRALFLPSSLSGPIFPRVHTHSREID